MGKRKFSSDISRATKFRRKECLHDCKENSFSSCNSEDSNIEDFSDAGSNLYSEEESTSKDEMSSTEDDSEYVMAYDNIEMEHNASNGDDVDTSTY